MSRAVFAALDAVQDSKFFIREREIEVRNAHIFWTNFQGRENRFGNSARTFNLAINEEVAEELTNTGWRVKTQTRDTDDGEVTLYFISVKINMKSYYPPTITLFTEYRGKRSRNTITEETLGTLDGIDIEMADLIINKYESKQFPGKVTGYLKKLNIVQEPAVEFGGKYDDWLDEEKDDTLLDDQQEYEGE